MAMEDMGAHGGDMMMLSPSVARLLSDRVYDKRKQAAQEIEYLVRELDRNSDTEGMNI